MAVHVNNTKLSEVIRRQLTLPVGDNSDCRLKR
jgi:hypothetical protein